MSDTDTPTLDVTKAETVTAPSLPGSNAPQLSISELCSVTSYSQADVPSELPPSESEGDISLADGISAWHNSKKVTAMWCNSATRNAYAAVSGVGWKRISNANDSSFVTLVALLSLAEQTGANTRLRIEGDGEIHEVYVF